MKKNKTLLLFIIFFSIYFILGFVFTYYFETYDKYEVFFGSDTKRVLNDLFVLSEGHYRTIVHPLFVILFQPLCIIFNLVIKEKVITAITIQSIVLSISIIYLYKFIKKINNNTKFNILLILIFGLSNAQLVFSSTIETFPFAQLFIILLLYYTYNIKDKRLDKKDYIILTLLGIISLGITITNFMVYILCIIYLVIKHKNNKLFNLLTLSIIPLSISVMLSEMQSVIFPTSNLFFRENIIQFLNNNSEELNYISGFSLSAIINQIKTIFGTAFISPDIELVYKDLKPNEFLAFKEINILLKSIFIVFFVCTIYYTINYFRKEKKINHKNSYVILLILIFMFNFILHIFYGNDEAFLYVQHYHFIIILIYAYILGKTKKSPKTITVFMTLYLIIEIIYNIISIINRYKIINNYFGVNETFKNIYIIILPLAIIFIIIFKYFICKTNKRKIIQLKH